MIQFAVSAIDRHGNRRSFREVAPDEPVLREKLRGEGLFPVQVKADRSRPTFARLKIPNAEFIALLQQLELQLRAGVTADSALAQLAEDAPEGTGRVMLRQIHGQVARGIPIHEACRVFERQFPPHLAAVIAAGEAAAQLPQSLKALAASLESSAELRKTAKRALIYPAVVLAATGGLVAFLLGGVVPQFASVFESLHMDLPAITVWLIAASRFVRENWPALACSLAGCGFLVWFSAKSTRLRVIRDRLALKLPLLGEIIRCLCTARFAAHCRLLHEAGIPLLEALKTGGELMNQRVLERQLAWAREHVATGRPLYASLPKPHDFPGFIVPALKSGETTGQLSAALLHIESYAAQRARERISTSLALLEPALLGTLTVIVGGIALSFFLPLFALMGGLNSR
jgi:type II secretory pathway component PulF